MIAPVDRSAELFASITRSESDGPVSTQSQLEPIVPSHAFTIHSAELSRQIIAMERELHSQRKRYIDFCGPRGLTDKDRDDLDGSVANFLKNCVAEIDNIKVAAVSELKRGYGNASFLAHQLGGVAILNEQLQAVSKLSEELRHARIRAAIDARAAPEVVYSKRAAKEASRAALEREVAAAGGVTSDATSNAADMEQYAQQFESENVALVNELVDTREQVREAEKTVVEIASLNQLLASKVLEQGREIESLYELAMEATMFVDRGNKELRKMKGKGPILKYCMSSLKLSCYFSAMPIALLSSAAVQVFTTLSACFLTYLPCFLFMTQTWAAESSCSSSPCFSSTGWPVGAAYFCPCCRRGGITLFLRCLSDTSQTVWGYYQSSHTSFCKYVLNPQKATEDKKSKTAPEVATWAPLHTFHGESDPHTLLLLRRQQRLRRGQRDERRCIIRDFDERSI